MDSYVKTNLPFSRNADDACSHHLGCQNVREWLPIGQVTPPKTKMYLPVPKHPMNGREMENIYLCPGCNIAAWVRCVSGAPPAAAAPPDVIEHCD